MGCASNYTSWKQVTERDRKIGVSHQSILMRATHGDLVYEQPCVQVASYLEGCPLMCKLPQHLHVNQNADDDDVFYMNHHVALQIVLC